MSFKHLTVPDLKKLIQVEQPVLVDVRDAASYQQRHIESAIHLHDGNVDSFLETTAKDSTVVVYCFHGHSSQGAANYLVEQGFSNVFSLDGGFTAWDAAEE